MRKKKCPICGKKRPFRAVGDRVEANRRSPMAGDARQPGQRWQKIDGRWVCGPCVTRFASGEAVLVKP